LLILVQLILSRDNPVGRVTFGYLTDWVVLMNHQKVNTKESFWVELLSDFALVSSEDQLPFNVHPKQLPTIPRRL